MQRHYDTQIVPTSENAYHTRHVMMTRLNGLDESLIGDQLLCPHMASWHNQDAYPQDFIFEIRQLLVGFHDQYAWPRDNLDHPIYRVEGQRYKIQTYVPGHKIYRQEFISDSEDNVNNDGG